VLTTPTPFPGVASAKCDGCQAEITVEAVNLDDTRERLKARGWHEVVRHGTGIRNWLWMCPKCSANNAKAQPGEG
jgi:hypothetical protein